MRQFSNLIRISALGVSVAAMPTGPANALLIVPTFGSSVTSQSNAAALEAAINTAASTIDGLYSNPGTVQILFDYSNSVLGQSQDGENFVTYSQYVAQLGADEAAHPSNTVLATALANISKGNGATATYVLGTTAFLRVGLGFTGQGVTPCYNAAGTYVSGCGQTYDGVITIGGVSTASGGLGQNSQAVSVVEHEMNEVLGGGGTGTTVGQSQSALIADLSFPANQLPQFIVGPTDLYRYHSTSATCAGVTSTPSFTTATGEVACYSINGGSTTLVQMNQSGGGADYGDFATTSPNNPYIQDAFYPGPTNDYSMLSPEFNMLESIGYDPNLPEPPSLALFAGAICGLGWFRRSGARTA
jgi:hypothetical protein